jgi:hypothetical protein
MNTTSKLAFIATVVAIGISSPVLAAQSRHRPDGQKAYAVVQHQDLNSSRFTGAGCSGYNEDEEIH